MGETKHTPGNWQLVDTSVVAGDVCIAVLETDGEYAAPSEQQRANGNLLAAAPLLLAECREALRWAENRPENWAYQLALRLSIAIAKAETPE